jgi:predicted secreted protein
MASKRFDLINARMNVSVKITLQSRTTAGYDWEPEFNEQELKLVKKNRIVSHRTLGASPKTVFDFEPLSKGDHEIIFILQRPWEGKPIEEKQIIVHVV